MKSLSLFVFFFLLLTVHKKVFSQSNDSYQVASMLIEQQKYEKALPILRNLHDLNPHIFMYLDRLVECHIQTKQYEEAKLILKASINKQLNVSFANTLLGKLFHLEGDVNTAYEIWDNTIEAYPNQLQLYYTLATLFIERREFDRAIDVYKRGREHFANENLFLLEIPNVYMQAGEYQNSVAEWLKIIVKKPSQASFFKRTLIRYNDPLLFEDSIAEIEYKLRNLPIDDPNYHVFFNLQNWLLFENKLYKRAFAAALKYEKSTTGFNYKLDEVGVWLAENQQFSLAIKAFEFYRDNSEDNVKINAYEKLADVYAQWAKFLEDYNLGNSIQIRNLYHHSSALLDTIIQTNSSYYRIGNVYLKQAELSLDHIFDLEQAKNAITLFKQISKTKNDAQIHYLDGRLHLAQNKYTLARIELTRSNRIAKNGRLAEKTRYFLALTDFYAGDFEYAAIQLKTLSRKYASFYANDALKLQLWLQDGINADTSNIQIQIFAHSIKELKTNPIGFDITKLLDFIDLYPTTPLRDDVLLAIAHHKIEWNARYLLTLNNFLATKTSSPIREQLLWIRANMAETHGYWISNSNFTTSILQSIESCLHNNVCSKEVLKNTSRQLYEELILEYPNGFYATYARKKLKELPI